MDGLTFLQKCLINIKKSSPVIQPDELALSIDPTGLLVKNQGFIFFRGKMNIGGTVFPIALTANATVTSVPLSPDVIAPTCFLPFTAIILDGRCTVVTPVSSTL